MNGFWQIVLLGLSIICFIISLFFLFSRNYRRKVSSIINHYSDKRDELTKKDAEIEEDEDENDSTGFSFENFSISKLVGATVALIVGINLFGGVKETIYSQFNSTAVDSQINGQVSTILGLTKIFFAIAFVTIIISTFMEIFIQEKL